MKKISVFVAALLAVSMFTACSSEKEEAKDNSSTSKIESSVDDTESKADEESVAETEAAEEEKVPVAAGIDDCPTLTIELKEGTFTYNGESFEDVYQQLTDLGIAKEKTEGRYAETGNFKSDWIEAANGTKFTIAYAKNNQILTVATGEGVKNKVAWDITVGNIDNTMTISDLVDMGAEALREESNAHGDRTTDYLLTSPNFETKGVSVKASGDGTPELEDLIVEGFEIKYSGIES